MLGAAGGSAIGLAGLLAAALHFRGELPFTPVWDAVRSAPLHGATLGAVAGGLRGYDYMTRRSEPAKQADLPTAVAPAYEPAGLPSKPGVHSPINSPGSAPDEPSVLKRAMMGGFVAAHQQQHQDSAARMRGLGRGATAMTSRTKRSQLEGVQAAHP